MNKEMQSSRREVGAYSQGPFSRLAQQAFGMPQRGHILKTDRYLLQQPFRSFISTIIPLACASERIRLSQWILVRYAGVRELHQCHPRGILVILVEH